MLSGFGIIASDGAGAFASRISWFVDCWDTYNCKVRHGIHTDLLPTSRDAFCRPLFSLNELHSVDIPMSSPRCRSCCRRTPRTQPALPPREAGLGPGFSRRMVQRGRGRPCAPCCRMSPLDLCGHHPRRRCWRPIRVSDNSSRYAGGSLASIERAPRPRLASGGAPFSGG